MPSGLNQLNASEHANSNPLRLLRRRRAKQALQARDELSDVRRVNVTLPVWTELTPRFDRVRSPGRTSRRRPAIRISACRSVGPDREEHPRSVYGRREHDAGYVRASVETKPIAGHEQLLQDCTLSDGLSVCEHRLRSLGREYWFRCRFGWILRNVGGDPPVARFNELNREFAVPEVCIERSRKRRRSEVLERREEPNPRRGLGRQVLQVEEVNVAGKIAEQPKEVRHTAQMCHAAGWARRDNAGECTPRSDRTGP